MCETFSHNIFHQTFFAVIFLSSAFVIRRHTSYIGAYDVLPGRRFRYETTVPRLCALALFPKIMIRGEGSSSFVRLKVLKANFILLVVISLK